MHLQPCRTALPARAAHGCATARRRIVRWLMQIWRARGVESTVVFRWIAVVTPARRKLGATLHWRGRGGSVAANSLRASRFTPPRLAPLGDLPSRGGWGPLRERGGSRASIKCPAALTRPPGAARA